MKLRSRGLGRRELVMDFRECEIRREGNEVVIQGTIREPVTWDFSIRIEPRDIPGMLRVGINHHTLGLGARWILHRKTRSSDGARSGSPGGRDSSAPPRDAGRPGNGIKVG
ncbi:MAG: hypothetical protein ACYDGN_09660 [Acidimicrobiales bacterium]